MRFRQPHFLRIIADQAWAAIARISGWRPGARTKNALEWVGIGTGAVLGVWGLIQLFAGDNPATKNDIAGLHERLREMEQRLDGGQRKSNAPDSNIAKGLEKGVESLLAAGRADVLKDKTGTAAEVAFDELIAQRQAARQRIAKDEADLYRQKGAFAFLHDPRKALPDYRKAIELDPDDPVGWNQLGSLQLQLGELDAAVTSFDQVLAFGNKANNQMLIAVATGNIGIIHFNRGNLKEAEVMHKKSLAIFELQGSKTGMADQFAHLGNIYITRTDLDAAEDMFKKALALNEEAGRKEDIADGYGNLGAVYNERGDLDAAEAMFKQSLALNETLGVKDGMAKAYSNLAGIYKVRGKLDPAEQMLRKSISIYEEILTIKAYRPHTAISDLFI